MIWVYIASQLANDVNDDDVKHKYTQALLKRAMVSVNKTAGLNLIYNYPVRAHQTTESYTEKIDYGDGVIMDKLNNSIICISDSDDEIDDIRANDNSIMNVISKKIEIQNDENESHAQSVDCCCCIFYNPIFEKYFKNTSFRLCADIQSGAIKCLACSQTVERTALNAHLKKCTKLCD